MSPSIHTQAEIEQVALKIPAKARLRLAAKLLASVPGSARFVLSDSEALDLAERRAAELDSGSVKGLDYRTEMDHIRASLDQ